MAASQEVRSLMATPGEADQENGIEESTVVVFRGRRLGGIVAASVIGAVLVVGGVRTTLTTTPGLKDSTLLTSASNVVYKELGTGYARTAADKYHCWLNMKMCVSDKECKGTCTADGDHCVGYTFDLLARQNEGNTNCYAYVNNCGQYARDVANYVGKKEKADGEPWSIEGPEAIVKTSNSPQTATTWKKMGTWSQAYAGDSWCGPKHKGQEKYKDVSVTPLVGNFDIGLKSDDQWKHDDKTGWHFTGLSEEQCKRACLEFGVCRELFYTNDNLCYPAQAHCKGGDLEGKKIVLYPLSSESKAAVVVAN